MKVPFSRPAGRNLAAKVQVLKEVYPDLYSTAAGARAPLPSAAAWRLGIEPSCQLKPPRCFGLAA